LIKNALFKITLALKGSVGDIREIMKFKESFYQNKNLKKVGA